MRLLMILAVFAASWIDGFAQKDPNEPVNKPARHRLDERVPIWLKAFNVTGVGIAYIEGGKIA